MNLPAFLRIPGVTHRAPGADLRNTQRKAGRNAHERATVTAQNDRITLLGLHSDSRTSIRKIKVRSVVNIIRFYCTVKTIKMLQLRPFKCYS